jgi:hypothetical protein
MTAAGRLAGTIETTLQDVAAVFRPSRPDAMVLFGSTVAYLEAPADAPAPNDIDILLVGDLLMASFDAARTPLPVEFHRFRTEELVAIATTLRYSPKAMALSRLYGKAVMRQHSRNIIAACLLLGARYRDFGIEQIDIDGREDPRDYSRHRVLLGQSWWQRLQAFARDRRSMAQRMADKIVGAHRFR